MTNENYLKAKMIIPQQNCLLKTQEDFQMYDQLCQIIIEHGSQFTTLFTRFVDKQPIRQQLLRWIENKTSKLNSLQHLKLSTRMYWIANGLSNFPKCQYEKCNKPILSNVKSYWRGYNNHCSVSCINRDHEVKKKIAMTKFEKYGDSAFNNRPKNNITCFTKYGMTNGGGSSLAHSKMHRKYYFNERYFDSAPEIAYFIWLIDHSIDFQYQPSQPFSYIFNGKIYKYFADFYVNGQFIEIKGDQFFDDNGILYCPYRNKTWTDEQYAKINERYKAKHQCMLKNHIAIFRYKEYKPFLDYVSAKYGKDYLKQFRINNPKKT